MLDGDFPKVLLVADGALGDSTGTGITLANAFSLWPQERLAQIHGRALTSDRGFRDVRSLQVDKSHMVGYGVAMGLARGAQRLRGNHDLPASRVDAAPEMPLRPPPARPVWQRAWLDQVPVRVRSDIQELVREFQPDVVLTTAGSVRVMTLARLASDMARVPLVPYFMDDWVATLYGDTVLAALPRKRLLRVFRSVMGRAPRGLAISQAMAEEYTDRYGIPFQMMGNLMPPPSEAAVKSAAASVNSGPLRLGYIGGLHLGRDQTMLKLAAAIEKRDDCQLTVVAPGNEERRSLSEWGRLEKTTLAPPVPAEQVASLAREFDVLVHVESFLPEQRKYTRLSLSTKIPQYLSAAKPVLAVGPSEIASIRYVHDNGVGVAVGDEAGAMSSALDVLRDPESRRLFARRAVARVTEDFSLEVGTDKLRVTLIRASAG